MSKERAKRRAERLAAGERSRASHERAMARRRRRRAALRRLVPRRRRTGRLFARRSRPQRAAIATGIMLALILVWLLVDSLATRVALTVLIAVSVPPLVVMTLDRRI